MSPRPQRHLFLVLFLLVAGSLFSASAQGVRRQAKPITFCEGGVLNGKVVVESNATYPRRARRAKAEGAVVVRVRINEGGRVYEAVACVGPPLLRRAAEEAAYRSHFAPTLLASEAVKVAGVLIYIFKLSEGRGALRRSSVANNIFGRRRSPAALSQAAI